MEYFLLALPAGSTLIFQRVRALCAEPYTQREAEAAVGLGTDNGISYDASAVTSEEQPAAMKSGTARS